MQKISRRIGIAENFLNLVKGTFESYDRTTYSKDGRYWVEGYIYDRKEFDAKKKELLG